MREESKRQHVVALDAMSMSTTRDDDLDSGAANTAALSAIDRELRPVQRRAVSPDEARNDEAVHAHATRGVAGAGQPLPHLDRIQASFGPQHDLSPVRAHVGGAAAESSRAIGAEAYATGKDVAFAHDPDVFTAAHEAAHVVQQQQGVSLLGGVGREGDTHEQHADTVAAAVVRGEPVGHLLDGPAPGGASPDNAVQRKTFTTTAAPSQGGTLDVEALRKELATLDKHAAVERRETQASMRQGDWDEARAGIDHARSIANNVIVTANNVDIAITSSAGLVAPAVAEVLRSEAADAREHALALLSETTQWERALDKMDEARRGPAAPYLQGASDDPAEVRAQANRDHPTAVCDLPDMQGTDPCPLTDEQRDAYRDDIAFEVQLAAKNWTTAIGQVRLEEALRKPEPDLAMLLAGMVLDALTGWIGKKVAGALVQAGGKAIAGKPSHWDAELEIAGEKGTWSDAAKDAGAAITTGAGEAGSTAAKMGMEQGKARAASKSLGSVIDEARSGLPTNADELLAARAGVADGWARSIHRGINYVTDTELQSAATALKDQAPTQSNFEAEIRRVLENFNKTVKSIDTYHKAVVVTNRHGAARTATVKKTTEPMKIRGSSMYDYGEAWNGGWTFVAWVDPGLQEIAMTKSAHVHATRDFISAESGDIEGAEVEAFAAYDPRKR